MTEQHIFRAGIIDYNPSLMTPDEVGAMGMPPELYNHLADKRQYAPTIASHFPYGVAWFDLEHPWRVDLAMKDRIHIDNLKNSDVLFLSGGGQSAYKYQEKIPGVFTPQEISNFDRSQEVTRSVLGRGRWVFGICLGGQVAEMAVGGKIGRLPEDESGKAPTEAGWLSHHLTSLGRKDEVFWNLPSKFYAPHLHSDFVEKLPKAGHKVQTENGVITVTKSWVLATRNGYLYKGVIQRPYLSYIQASLVEFDNGARLYQIQPHPEMATPKKANFLVRQNRSWLEKEMGSEHFAEAMKVPSDADFSVAKTITAFVDKARRRAQELEAVDFVAATLPLAIEQYLIP